MNDVQPTLRVYNVARPIRVLWGGLLVAAVGGVLVGLGVWLAPERTHHSYLAAFAGITGLSLGGLVLLMIIHAMNASWPVVVRRAIETVVAPLPVLAIAFLLVALWLPELYAWAGPVPALADEHERELLAHKQAWLRDTWFFARTAVYFACWLLLGFVLRSWSHRQDDHYDPRLLGRMRALSAGGLPIVALTLTFAAFDWLMSLDPLWMSTIFGLYYFAGSFGAATATIILVVGALDRSDALGPWLAPSHYSALGRVLLAATALWGYFGFFQLMLIWIANRPDEVVWYLDRLQGSWQVFAIVLALIHLAVPLLALLSYRLKRQRRPLSMVAGLMLVAHYADMQWVVVPRSGSSWPLHWADPGPWLLLGGLSVLWGAWRLHGRAVAPRHDPRLPKGARYRSA